MSVASLLRDDGLYYGNLITNNLQLEDRITVTNINGSYVRFLEERVQALETYILALQETYQIVDAEGNTIRLSRPIQSG